MNLPILLTLLRIALIIPFTLLLMKGTYIESLLSFGIYLIASITDYLDGYLARKMKKVSSLGAFLDPLADKVLVLVSFIIFSVKGYIYLPLFLIILMIIREYFVTAMRIESGILKSDKITFITSKEAKFKTVFQIFTIAFFYFTYFVKAGFITIVSYQYIHIFPTVLFSISLIIALYSGYNYLKNYLVTAYKALVKSVISIFYIGYIPFMPGTIATIACGVFLYFLQISFLYYIIIFITLTIIGYYFAEKAELLFHVKDPGYIVIDEFIGFMIVGLPLFLQPLYSIAIIDSHKIFIYLLAGFVLFRFFDIAKPFGLKKLQNFKGGIGILIDDVAAGILSLAILLIAFGFINKTIQL